MKSELNSNSSSSKSLQTSRMLRRFLERHEGEYVSLRELLDGLGNRAFGPTLLVCSLPEALPLPVAGMSAIIGIPLMLLSVQLLLGFPRPWLPSWIANRSLKRIHFEKIVEKLLHYLEKVERVIRPRWRFATTPLVERLLGLLFLILATVIFLPIPFGNMLPALAMFVISLGLIEGDGVVIVWGVVVAFVILTLMASAIIAFLFWTAIFLVNILNNLSFL